MKKVLVLFALATALTLSVSAKHVVINLTKQRACAYEGGRAVFCGNVSTGKPGHRTPTGYFRVLEKDIDHVSSKYPEPNGGAKMHYMLRLTSSGIAMHLGYVPNYPASHGCIRLQNGFAQRMYRWASVGTPVRIIGSPPSYVNRSSYNSTYYSARRNTPRRTIRRSPRRTYNATATDILAEFMGKPTRKVTRKTRRTRVSKKRRYISRKRRTSSRRYNRRIRHKDPLIAMSGTQLR